ncbi:FAD-dependent oxidoreductase [Rhodospirillaceae bacterium]|nr:FAD-dependent oxidoreductase [Rhodospirillaceae bacterium]
MGGGVIGVEYATIFSALDIPVTLLESRDTILDFVDQEIIATLLHELRDRGVVLRLGTAIEGISRVKNGRCKITLKSGRLIRSDMVLFAAGRYGATGELGLENVGIVPDDRGRLSVDDKTFQTDVPHIYAVGDIIGFPSLASTSMEQGRIAACHAFNQLGYAPPEFFPYGIYSVPEISTVGMTEEEAKVAGIPYEVGIARFRETSRGHIMGLESGMMKMIVSLETRKLLGVHIIGEGATELIHIGQAVLNLNGPVEYFVENTFNYPTLAEAYKIAALDVWNRMPRAN